MWLRPPEGGAYYQLLFSCTALCTPTQPTAPGWRWNDLHPYNPSIILHRCEYVGGKNAVDQFSSLYSRLYMMPSWTLSPPLWLHRLWCWLQTKCLVCSQPLPRSLTAADIDKLAKKNPLVLSFCHRNRILAFNSAQTDVGLNITCTNKMLVFIISTAIWITCYLCEHVKTTSWVSFTTLIRLITGKSMYTQSVSTQTEFKFKLKKIGFNVVHKTWAPWS